MTGAGRSSSGMPGKRADARGETPDAKSAGERGFPGDYDEEEVMQRDCRAGLSGLAWIGLSACA